MMRGVVNARREAVLTLQVRGPSGTAVAIDGVVDPGFTASLTLPPAVVSTLRMVRQSSGGAVLADGSVRQFDIYAAEVEWDGAWRGCWSLRSVTRC